MIFRAMSRHYIPIDASIVATEEKLNDLTALEELVMVGYPIGLWDAVNNFPIFRRGYTAAHPAIDFNKTGIGLVDMACFPGSSGSPIFIYNESSYLSKNGGISMGRRILFLGMLYASPYYDAQGKLIVTTILTKQLITSTTPVMTNLGYYIKALELNEFCEYVKVNYT